MVAYQGGNVALTDFNAAEGKETVEQITKDFPECRATFYACDITDETAWDGFMADAIKQHGTLHGLAHCAGIFTGGQEIHEQSLAVFERELKVNTVGTYIANRAMVKAFIDQVAAGVEVPEGGWSIV